MQVRPNESSQMNIISLILAIIGIVIFVLAYEGHKYGSLGLGLAFVSTAWVIQLLWPSLAQITV